MSTPSSLPPAPGGDAASLPGGWRLNEYVLERPLGGGGFGITYLARDANLELPVAIKEYFPADLVMRGADHAVQVRQDAEDHQGSFASGLERFLDEARALAAFRHPNIVRVLRYFRANGTAYIVMEYESGLSLKRWVPHHAPLSRASVLSIVNPLLDGLEAVHQLGFLHRDIKPDNVYVRADGSPVLLDFGAARRLDGKQDLTNIVSPGFAPFEQYHSQGHQGPWTDLYSLGAVMYWMTTGKKPLESAARVKHDGLLPAAALADVGAFGSGLLAAIDWAMRPDESQRPQTVAQFRQALEAEAAAAGAVPHGAREVPDPGAGAFADRSAPSATSGASGVSGTSAAAAQRRNVVCTIMFLDLVGYSIRSVDDQAAIKKLLNEMIGKALRGVPEDSRIAIDTGDGAAICFLGDPEEALHCAMLLRDLLGQRYGGALSARIGLHMGPVRVISDLNARVNVIGDGINVAQRVMDFAQGHQVLVSRAYFDVISRITDDTADLFEHLGQHEDKHGRLHDLYAARASIADPTRTRRQGPSTGYTQTQPARTSPALDDGAVRALESELARHIGPLARVLVRKAQPLAHSLEALREALSPSIQDPAARDGFRKGVAAHSHALGRSRSGADAGHSATQPRDSVSGHSGPPRSAETSRSGSTGASGPSAGAGPVELPADELAALELALSRQLGPMARMIVRREVARTTGFKPLVAALAQQLDQPAQREQFLQALRRALPQRPF